MRWLTALLTTAVLLVGCSGDDRPEASNSSAASASAASSSSGSTGSATSATSATMIAATEADYVAAVGASGTGVDECYVTATVRAFGVDALRNAGISPETFATDGPDELPVKISDAAIPQLHNDLAACGDPVALVSGILGAPEDCVRASATADLALDAVVDLARGAGDESPESPLGRLFAIIDSCSPPPTTDAGT